MPQKIFFVPTLYLNARVFIYKGYMKKDKVAGKKNEFVRLRIDAIEKKRLDKLCGITRRQKSDLIRESLFELYKTKYPECLKD